MDEAPDAAAPLPAFDAIALAAEIRKGDEAALQRAYRHVFAGDLGRLVLADFARSCGVAQPLGVSQFVGDLETRAGKHDAALILATAAGYDQSDLVMMIFTQPAPEQTHERDPDRDVDFGRGYQPRPDDDLDFD